MAQDTAKARIKCQCCRVDVHLQPDQKDQLRKKHRSYTFRAVSHQRDDPGLDAHDTEHVGGSRIAAALLPDIYIFRFGIDLRDLQQTKAVADHQT